MVSILAIESSCDDTAAAVLIDGVVRSNVVSSQVVHALYGGVVPEVAARSHDSEIVAVCQQALTDAGASLSQLSAVACTQGPGLIGPLLVGSCFARALAFGRRLPFIAVHHMQAHILAHFIEPPVPSFPFLCLTVSGGHTQLVLVRDYLDMEILGQSLDDAAGEAFDKAGKLLQLPYPAGPHVDRLASTGRPVFPLAKPHVDGYNFSFSGLKTSFLYFIRDQKAKNPDFIEENLHDLCASLQHRIIEVLLTKLSAAAEATGIHQIALAGGVAANSGLRSALQALSRDKGWQVYIPALEHCTDNAAMIAMAAYLKYRAGQFDDLHQAPDPRLSWLGTTPIR